MCGIFGVVGKEKQLPQIVFEGLKTLEYRGYDSWGIAAVNSKSQILNPKFTLEKHVGKIGFSTLNSQLSILNSGLALGHTRWATHGGVTVKNAHPHLDCTGKIALVHNGIVENFESLKKNLKKGHKFRSQTDTEVIVHLIEELRLRFPFEEAVRRVFLKLKGLNAIVVMDLGAEEIVAAKNGSPLVVGTNTSANYIASDQLPLTAHCPKIAFLEDNTLALLSKNKICIKNVRSGKNLEPHFVKPTTRLADTSLGRFNHFMEKEIHQTPQIIKSLGKSASPDIKKAADMVKSVLPAGRQVYLLGCGTASYAALTMKYLLAHIAGINSQAVVASEFGHLEKFIRKGDVIIAYSQSGETADLITALKEAKKKGAKILAIINVESSSIDRFADTSLRLNAGPELAVVSTKAFSAMVAISYLVCREIKGKVSQALVDLKILSKALKAQLKGNLIDQLARKLSPQESVFAIGRDIDYPLSLETALKLKEAAYIHVEGFAAGELKHGVIALIEKGTPVIVFASSEEYFAEIISSAQELKSRGAYIVGVSIKNNSVFDYYLPLPNLGLVSTVSAAVYAQLLAYKSAVKRGLDPDKPRNLAKSVTVK